MTLKKSPGSVDYLLLLTLAAIFGGSFSLIALALESFGPISVVAIRVLLAAIILLLVMWLKGQSLPNFGVIWVGIIASAILGNALPFLLISFGQETVDAGLAGILIATTPLITVFLADRFTVDEKLTRITLAGVALGLCGVVLLFGVDKLTSLGKQAIGQYAIIGAALCYAINVLVMRRLTHLPRYGMIAALLLVSSAVMVPLSIYFENPFSNVPTTRSVVAVCLLGIIATAGGNLLRFVIVSRQGASFLSQLNTFVPIFGAAWAWLLLGENLPPNAVLAMLLILSGVFVASLKPKSNVVQLKE